MLSFQKQERSVFSPRRDNERNEQEIALAMQCMRCNKTLYSDAKGKGRSRQESKESGKCSSTRLDRGDVTARGRMRPPQITFARYSVYRNPGRIWQKRGQQDWGGVTSFTGWMLFAAITSRHVVAVCVQTRPVKLWCVARAGRVEESRHGPATTRQQATVGHSEEEADTARRLPGARSVFACGLAVIGKRSLIKGPTFGGR